MKKQIMRLMAYVYMPLIFTVIGYGAIYIATAPMIQLVYNVASMVMAQDPPNFHTPLDSIYKPLLEEGGQGSKVNRSDVQYPAIGQQYGEIICDRIELKAPLYFGDNNDILRVGVGQYQGSLLPGFGRMMLLCAHNTTFFKPLQIVEVGDIFQITTSYGKYEYQVYSKKIADHRDSTAYDLMKNEEELVMYTCYPFETLAGTKTDRLFVYANKIAGPEVID